MPGRLTTAYWPPWPQFTGVKTGEHKIENAEYKKQIVAQYGAEAIRQSWVETCRELKTVTEEIASKRSSIIPVLTLDDLLTANSAKREELKAMGCFVVRGVVPRNEATEWYHQLKGYVTDNKESVTGSCIFPCLILYENCPHMSKI